MALPVLGWSRPCLAPPCHFHTSRDSSHISPWGGSQDQASRKGRAQNISSVLFKVAPWQAETAVHPTFPNWGWMGQRTTLGKGPCLYKGGPKVSDPCHHKVCVKVVLAFRKPHWEELYVCIGKAKGLGTTLPQGLSKNVRLSFTHRGGQHGERESRALFFVHTVKQSLPGPLSPSTSSCTPEWASSVRPSC